MLNVIIYIFMIVANIVALILAYYSLEKNMERKKKFLSLMLCVGISYCVVSVIFWLSTIGIDKKIVENLKDMIVFTFVPVNIILIVPILLKTMKDVKNKILKIEKANRRIIIIGIISIILLIGEYIYFRNITKNIMNDINNRIKESKEIVVKDQGNLDVIMENNLN